jgi:outer membrane biosynthesis protein TonB
LVTAAGVLWLPLGELLVERGLLSTVQLELALAEQRRTGLRLGEVLVSMGYVSESALARMLLEQVGLTAPPQPEPQVEQPDEHLEAAAVLEPEPEPEPEQEPEPEPAPFLEPEAVVIEASVTEPRPALAQEPATEPMIVRMEDTPRERGRWWARNGNKARVKELEKVLSDFEERSRAIEADIARVRTTLRSLRDAGA